MDLTLSRGAAFVLRALHDAGFEAYVVGGCVRDSLLGRLPGDWDVTTSALPEETKTALADLPVIETGLRHGTVTAVVAGEPVEVTTFRVDGPYSDGRRPDTVAFTRNLTDDLARRDFTVNAMAWSSEAGLADPFGGREDLRRRVIRCVGEPARRFGEDALRILRALRFSAALGFAVEPGTAAALREGRARLAGVSAERVAAELSKLACGENAPAVLREFPEVIAQVLPEWDCDPGALGRAPADLPVRLAMLFPSAREAKTALRRLKYDNATACAAEALCAFRSAPLEASRPAVRRMLHTLGPEAFRRLLAMRAAYGEPFADVERTLDAVLAGGDCWSLESLAVKGGDLIAAGVPVGPEVGRTLAAMLDAVIDGRCPNDRAALLAFASRLKN